MIGEVQALLDDRVDVARPVLAGALARVEQHVLDDRVGPLAVLRHLVEVAFQHCPTARRSPPSVFAVESRALSDSSQLIDQLRRERREVVDEVQRVLDLMRDAGGELAERGKLFGLDKPVLRCLQLLE